MNEIQLKELILCGNECTYLDYKKVEYNKDNKSELIKDIVSMANSNHIGEKYIIIGIKHTPGQDLDICGVEAITDEANYQQLLQENVEPEINFQYFDMIINDKKIAVFRIFDTTNKPYLLKKHHDKLEKGDGWIRVGSKKRPLIRNDLEQMYSDRDLKKQYEEKKVVKRIEKLHKELLIIDSIEIEKKLLDQLSEKFRSASSFINEIKNQIENSKLGRSYKYEWNHKDEIKIIHMFMCINIKDFNRNYYFDLLKDINEEYSKRYLTELMEMEYDYFNLKSKLKSIRENISNYLVNDSEKTMRFIRLVNEISNYDAYERMRLGKNYINVCDLMEISFFEERRKEITEEISELNKSL